MLLPIALALAAPGPAQSVGKPVVTQDSPSTFTIHRPIVAEPVPVRDATAGLLGDWRSDRERDRQREDAEDAAIERAFEEAIDQARSLRPRTLRD